MMSLLPPFHCRRCRVPAESRVFGDDSTTGHLFSKCPSCETEEDSEVTFKALTDPDAGLESKFYLPELKKPR